MTNREWMARKLRDLARQAWKMEARWRLPQRMPDRLALAVCLETRFLRLNTLNAVRVHSVLAPAVEGGLQ